MIINSWFCAAPRDCLCLLFSRVWFCLCRSVDGEGWISQTMERKKCLLRLHCAQPSSQRRHFSSSASEASPDEHKWTQINKIIHKDKKAEISHTAQLTNPGKVLILSVQVCLPHKISISPYSPTHKLYLLTYTLPSFLRLRFTVVKL